MGVLTKIEINGIDSTSYLMNYSCEFSNEENISVSTIILNKNVFNSVTIAPGQTIEIWRGSATATDKMIFNGYIEKYQPDKGTVKITAKDRMWDLVRKEINHTYDSAIDASAGKISAIFEDMVETYGGLTASVQDSGTTILLNKFVCNHTDIFERCKALAKLLDWQFYYRSDTDIVYFEPKGYADSGLTFNVGTEIVALPQWNYDNTEMVNDLYVYGAMQEVETTESGRIGTTTGFTTASIALTYVPNSVKAYGDAANPPTTLKAGGVPDVTATYDYYVDKNQKKLYPKAGTTFTNAHYFEIRYSCLIPTPIRLYNQPSIDDYGRTTKTITYKDLKSVADAEARGSQYLVKYSTPFIYTNVKVKIANSVTLNVGELLTIVDAKSTPNVNAQLVVNRIIMNYPGTYDEVYVGDREWRLAEWSSDIEDKIKRLQETESNAEITTELLSVDDSLNNQINITPRYFKNFSRTYDVAKDRLIWDHPLYSEWDNLKWSDGTDDSMEAEVPIEILHYQNTYEEEFVDTDFINAASTCTINTTTFKAVF